MSNNGIKTVDIIGYDCGWGCKDFGCEDGPLNLPREKLLGVLGAGGMQGHWSGPLGIKGYSSHDGRDTKDKTLDFVEKAITLLADRTGTSAAAGHIPLVIGGDHSSAIGTWSGVTTALDACGAFGLIWIDAHLDAHTLETSYQGKFGGWWHGQGVTALTGHGISRFTSLCSDMKKISPEHLTIIGVHSFEPAEIEYITAQGIKAYSLEDVRTIGFDAAFQSAIERATNGTKGFGITLDIDVFDPADAPGVGTAEDIGLSPADVLPILRGIAHHPAFKALEIAEFNPHKDIDGKTLRLLERIVESAFTKSATI